MNDIKREAAAAREQRLHRMIVDLEVRIGERREVIERETRAAEMDAHMLHELEERRREAFAEAHGGAFNPRVVGDFNRVGGGEEPPESKEDDQ